MAFNATLGHWEQTSFVSVAEADAYFSAHIETSVWAAYSTAVKQQVLSMASRVLDKVELFAPQNISRLYASGPYAQALGLPLSGHQMASGTADSGSTTTIVCSTFADPMTYRDDLFNYGAVRITAGTNIYEHKPITDFAVATGTITVGEAFTAAIDSTSIFEVIYPLTIHEREAVCEFASIIARTGGQYDAAQSAYALEPGGKNPLNVLPGRILTMLKAHQRGVYGTERR